jgi:hypothetical protein
MILKMKSYYENIHLNDCSTIITNVRLLENNKNRHSKLFFENVVIEIQCESDVYWAVHHCDSLRIKDQVK